MYIECDTSTSSKTHGRPCRAHPHDDTHLQSFLCNSELNDPQDAEVVKHYMTSHSSFEGARYWTHMYAGGPTPSSATPGGAVSGKAGAAVLDEVGLAGLAYVDQCE